MENDKRPYKSPEDCLRAAGMSPGYELKPLAGGDINDTALLTTDCGQRFCIKQHAAAAEDFFAAEAAGLKAITRHCTLRIPQVVCIGQRFILLEYIEAGRKNPHYWQDLGEGLARMHKQKQAHFGFTMDNYCGLTPQRNPPSNDGHAFYRDHRIMYQAQMAFANGLLSAGELKQIESFAWRLEELIPEQDAALLHGDLWAGNIHSDAKGRPVLIDPAAYYGWPEADIAMTLLFGGFSETFYDSYLAVKSLEPGWRQRASIYNVYHLLNHLNLFGGGYRSQVMAVVSRYTSSH